MASYRVAGQTRIKYANYRVAANENNITGCLPTRQPSANKAQRNLKIPWGYQVIKFYDKRKINKVNYKYKISDVNNEIISEGL